HIEDKGAIILGAPIASEDKEIFRLAKTICDSHDTFFESLLHPELSTQNSMLLLRGCGISKFIYLLRTCRPSAITQLTKSIDDKILNSALKKLQLSWTSAENGSQWDNALLQFQLPLRMGGFGLHRLEKLSPIAYYASMAAAVENATFLELKQHSVSAKAGNLNTTEINQLNSCISTFSSLLLPEYLSKLSSLIPQDPTQTFQSQFSPSISPSNSQIFKRKAPGLQHLFSDALHLTLKSKLTSNVEQLDNKEKTRLCGISAPLANLWKSAFPNTSATTLTNPQYEIASRLSLGFKPFDALPVECQACHRSGFPAEHYSLANDHWHYLTCSTRRNVELNIRHNQIQKSLSEAANICGASSTVEPVKLNRENFQRPDVQIIMGGKETLVDVSVVHPAASGYLRYDYSRETLGAARTRAQEKIKKYSQMMRHRYNISPNSFFVPFIAETYGGICQQAQQLMLELSVFSLQHSSVWTDEEIINYLKFTIAVAIQRGNASACLSGYSYDSRIITSFSQRSNNCSFPIINSIGYHRRGGPI
ncbi:MAG TPA: hypothetical protein VNX68_14270, partial [Nitrosopumilaceae archaeon]|nr:hypothetical protein [Nitrosopumilaceae archaeon]